MTRMGAATLLKVPKRQGVGGEESPTLENLIKECTETKANWGLVENDIVFTLAVWSMVKCGFRYICSGGSEALLKDANEKTLPKDWKHETRQIYEAEFFLPPYSDHPVKLVALPAEDILCINVIASSISSKNVNLKSLAVYTPGYVPRPEEDVLSSKFSGLNDFQFLLRNVIIWPIRCSILTDQGIVNGSLCGLSDEIKLKIVRHLPFADVLMLSETCHGLNRVCNDQGLWKTYFHNCFKFLCECASGSKPCDREADWKESFKQAYVQKRSEKGFQNSPSASYVTAREAPYGSQIDFDID